MAKSNATQTVSRVSEVEAKQAHELAASLGVTLHNFEANVIPDLNQIRYAAQLGQDLYYNAKTNLSWQAAKRSSKGGQAINGRNGPFQASQLAEGLDALLQYTPNMAKRGSAWNCIVIESVRQQGDGVTFTMSNGQQYKAVFTEVRPATETKPTSKPVTTK